MIVRVYQYFLSIRQRQSQRQDSSLRKEIASVLGIGEATVARVVAEYNGSENEEFSRQTIQGRPKKGLDHNSLNNTNLLCPQTFPVPLILIFLLLETNY